MKIEKQNEIRIPFCKQGAGEQGEAIEETLVYEYEYQYEYFRSRVEVTIYIVCRMYGSITYFREGFLVKKQCFFVKYAVL